MNNYQSHAGNKKKYLFIANQIRYMSDIKQLKNNKENKNCNNKNNVILQKLILY